MSNDSDDKFKQERLRLESEPDTESETHPEPKPDTEPDSEPVSDPDSDPDSEPDSEPDSALDPERNRKNDASARRLFRLTVHWWVAAAIMAGIVLLRQLPWTTFTYPEDLNNAWVLSLNYLTMHHAQCGRDFSFTFGPLGLCYPKGFIPETYSILVLLWSVLAFAQLVICFRIAKRLFSNPLFAVVWYACLAAPLSVFGDVFFLAPAALILLSYFCIDSRSNKITFETWLCACLLGVTAAVKFTFFIGNAFVLCFLAFDQIFRRRQPPTLALLSFSVFVICWVVSGQHMDVLPQYLATSLEISRGHSEAMCLGDPQDLWLAVLYIASVGIFLALLCARLYGSLKLWSITPVLATAGYCFLVFKAAYARQDWGHQVIAASTFAYLLTLFLPILLKHEGWRWVRHGTLPLLVACIFLTIPLNLKIAWWTYPVFVIKTMTLDSWNNLAKIGDFFSGSQTRIQRYNELMKRLAGPDSDYLKRLKGTVDCYPVNCSVVLANALRYDPRPVVQSYCAYTKALATQNANHLKGAGAPDWLLLENMVTPPDDWYPTINDNLSWPEFLTRYEPFECRKDFLVLKKSTPADTRTAEKITVSESTHSFGESVSVSDAPTASPTDESTASPTEEPTVSSGSALTWAEIDVTPTALGKVQNVLFRTFAPVLTVTLKDGTIHSYKAPSELLRCGFILSPYMSTSNDLRFLYKEGWQKDLIGKEVVSISVTDPNNQSPYPVYGDKYKLRLSSLQIRPLKP